MANQLSSSPSVNQEVFPDANVTPQASPLAFGAQVGEATSRFGGQLEDTGGVIAQNVLKWQDLRNEATAQDLDTQFQGQLGQLDNAFYALKGKAASDAFPKYQADVMALRQQYLGSVPNPAVANMLGTSVKYSTSRSLINSGRYAGEQQRAWMGDAALSRVNMVVYNGGRNATDPDFWAQSNAAIISGAKNLQDVNGWSDEHTQLFIASQQAAMRKQAIDTITAQFKGAPVGDAMRALIVANGGGGSQAQSGKVGGSDYLAQLFQTEFGSGQDNPNNPTHTGYNQGDAAWNARFMQGGDPHNLQDAIKGANAETAYNLPRLERALNRPVTNGDLYLAHQQGLDGAIKLLTNPGKPATDLVGTDAVLANGGNETMNAADFANLWTSRFNGGTTPDQIAAAGGPLNQGLVAAGQTLQSLAPDEFQKLSKETLADATTQANAAYTDWEHGQKVQEAQIKNNIASVEFGARNAMWDQHNDPSKPRVDISMLAKQPQFATADGREMIDRLIKFQTWLDQPPKNDTVSAQATVNVLDRIGLPAGDPNKITQQSQLDALLPTMTMEQYKLASTRLKDASTPQGESLAGVRKRTFDQIKGQILRTGAIGIEPDATQIPNVEHQNYLQYQYDVGQLEAEYKAQGKNPSTTLYNPKSPDFVGSPEFLSKYIISPQQRLDALAMDQSGKMSMPSDFAAAPIASDPVVGGVVGTAEAQPEASTKSYTDLDALQAAINAHQITFDDAKAYAKAHSLKWAKDTAKPQAALPEVPSGE